MSATVVHADCCIVGGGPAGLMLGYLLARAGVGVVVLEKHDDFFRDFRGDTIHPSTLRVLDELGLRDGLLALPHDEVSSFDVVIGRTRLKLVRFDSLPAPDNALTFMPQWDFLSFLAEQASAYATFQLRMGTVATALLEEGGAVAGVTADGPDGPIKVRARLTVAADGRSSLIRAASGLPTTDLGAPIDVLWFRLPKPERVPRPTLGYLDGRMLLLTIPRADYYQAGIVIPKGGAEAIRAEGLASLRTTISRIAPFLAPVVDAIETWDDVKLLSVQVDRLTRWYRAGLLCIGDAAHAMSPAFGVGVNYAIQDAVAAANLLVDPLTTGVIREKHLAAVQARRMPAVALMQPIQLAMHRRISGQRGRPLLKNPPSPPQRIALRLLLPLTRRFGAPMIGYGFRPERISAGLAASFAVAAE